MVFSLDARRRRKQGSARPIEEWEASWPIKAGQLYIALFYFWSAIAKHRMSGIEWFGGGRIRDLLLSRSLREGFADGTAAGSQMAFEMAHHDWLTLLLGASTFALEFGFPLILLVRDTRLRLLFLLGVSGFHIANYYLVNVQFLWLPVVFLLFFDISKPLASRRARTAAA